MKKQAIVSQSKASFVRWWNIVIALLVVGLIVGSWAVIAQMARKQLPSPAGTKVAMPNGANQDVYTAYNNVVYKFNGNNGAVIWQFALKQAYQPDRRSGSYLQLAVVNNVVYAAIEYGIYALDANTGKQIWHYAPHLTPAELAQDRGRIGEIYVDQSVMYIDMTRGDMAALNLQTGALKWSNLSFPDGGSFSASGDTFYASEFSTQIPILHAIDGTTGKERWHFERQLINTSLSSTFIFDRVVYSSGNPLYALDAHTGKKLWEQRLPMGAAYFDDLYLRNGVLYVNTDAAVALEGGEAVPPDYYHVFAFDAQTGKQLWESQAGYRLRDEVIDSGKSVLVETVVQKQYSLQALDAATGAQRWQITPDASCGTSPGPCSPQIAASNKYLYVLSGNTSYTLQVFDTHTGQQVGRYPVAIPVKEGLDLSTLGNGMLYVRTTQHQGDAYSAGSSTSFTHYIIYAIHLTNGATNWKYDIGALMDVQVPITELILAP